MKEAIVTSVYCEECGSACSATGSFCEQCGHAHTQGGASVGVAAPNPSSSQTETIDPPISAEPTPAALRGIAMDSGSGSARSKAWIYYVLLAVLSFVGVCTGKAVGLVGMALFGWYAFYLYQGGRVVIWFW
jgi:hypothetical protein